MRSSDGDKIEEITLNLDIAKLKENNPEFKELRLNLSLSPRNCVDDQKSRKRIRLYEFFIEALEKNKTLERIRFDTIDRKSALYFAGGKSGFTYAKMIGMALGNHPTLRYVNIRRQHSARVTLGFLHCLGSANIEHLTLCIINSAPTSIMNYLGNVGICLQKTARLKSLSIKKIDIPRDLPEKKEINTSAHTDDKTPLKAPLKDFVAGLGAQRNLQILYLKDLPIGDNGIKEIQEALKGVTSIRKLTFQGCGIKEEAKQVCYIGLNNPAALQKLDLMFNPIGEEGIKDIIRSLPIFTNLEILKLGGEKGNFNYSALGFLVDTYLDRGSSVTDLYICLNEINEQSLGLLIQLLTNNPTLKKLNLRNSINGSQLQKFIPVLMNPVRCRLESLKFSTCSPISGKDAYDMLIPVLKINNFIYVDIIANDNYKDEEYKKLCNINKNLREWDDFITVTLCLLGAHYSLATTTRFTFVPSPLIFAILSFMEPQTPNMKKKSKNSKDSTTLCMELINKNLFKRQDLIKKKEYSPDRDLKKNAYQANKKIISKWWSTTSITDSNRVLFLPCSQKNLTL